MKLLAGLCLCLCIHAGTGKTDCQLQQEVGTDLTYERFMSEYYDKMPVLIKDGAANWSSLSWEPEDFVSRYGDFDIHLRDKRELPELGRRARVVSTLSVREYIESIKSKNLPLFDNRYTALTRALRADLDMQKMATRMVRETPILSIGGKGTGVGFHAHTENWIAQLGGRKVWFLVDRDSAGNPGIDPNPCGYLKNPPKGNFQLKRCIVRPNDIIYLPGGWAHATCNLDQWTLGIGAQSTIASRSALTAAVMDGDEVKVRSLVAKGGQKVLYELDSDGDTAARVAAHTGSASMLALLVELGLSFEKDEKVRSKDSGRGVLNELASYGHTDAMDWLFKQGMNPNLQGLDGSTALHHACLNSHAETIKALLAQASINLLVANSIGNVALHNAARSCNEDVLGLVSKAAPEALLIRNGAGLTPVDLAKKEGCDQADRLAKAAKLVAKLAEL